MKPRKNPFLRSNALILAGSIAMLFGGHSAQAANGTWLNTGLSNGNWSTALNWVGGTVPGSTVAITGTNADTSVATFNTALGTFGTSGSPILIDSTSLNIAGITFDTASVGSYFIGTTGGNSLFLSSGGTIQMTATAITATQTVNAPLVIQGVSGTYTFQNNSTSTGTLVIGGQVSGGHASAQTLNLAGTQTGNNTVSGNIVNGTATSLAINKSGAGTWILGGTNSYSGTTTISGGTLSLTGSNSGNGAIILSTGTLSFNSAAALGTGAISATTSNNTLTTAGASAITLASTNTLTLTNPAVFTINGTQALTFAGGFTQTSGGSPILTVSNTGGTTFNGGFALNTGAGGLIINGTANTTIGGVVSGVSKGLTYSGSGTLTLSNVGNTHTGTTTINSGTVTVSGNASSAPTVNGGTYNLTGTQSGNNNIIVNATNATSGSFGTFSQSATGVVSGTGTLTINGSQVFGATAGSATLLGNNTYTGTNTLGSAQSNNTASPYNIASLVAPTLTLSGANNGQASFSVNLGATLKLDFGAGGTAINDILNTTANTTGVTLTGGTLNITGKSATTNSQRIGGTLTFGSNTSNAVSLNAVGGGTLNVAFGGVTRNAGSVVDFALPSLGLVTTTTTGNIGTNKVLAASGTVAYATVGGTTWATNSGAATSVIGSLASGSYQTGANSFTSATGDTDITTSVNTGTLFTTNTLRFNTDGLTLTNTGASVVTSGGILITPNVATTGVTITGGTSIKSGAGNEMVIINNGRLTFNTPIVNASGAITVGSSRGFSGVSTFSGANTFNALNVNSGSATFSGNNTISGAVTVGYGATLTLSGSNTVTGTGFTWGANGGGTLVLAGAGALGTGILNTSGSGQTNMVKFASDVQVSGGASPTASINWTGGNGAFIQNYVMDRATAAAGAVDVAFSSALLNQAGTWNLLQGSNYTGSALPTLTVNGATTYGAGNNVTTFNINASGANVSLGALAPITFANAVSGNVQTMNLNGSSAGNLISGVIANGAATSNITTATITQATVGSSTVAVSSATGIVQGLTLTGYTGITNGTIVTNVSGTTLTLSAPTTAALSAATGTVNTANVANLNKTGTGTWTLSGANTFTGQTAVNGGTLVLDYATNNNSKIATNLLTLNGGTLQLKGGSFAQTVASTTLGTTAGQAAITRNTGTSTIALGTLTFSNGALNFGTTGIATTTTANVASGILSARATVAGTDWAANNGANSVVAYTAYNTTLPATGSTSTVNYSLTGSQTVTAGQTVNTLKIATSGAGQSLTLANNVTFIMANNGLLFTGSDAYSITTAGTGRVSASGGTIFLQHWGTGVLTLGATGSGLDKYGTGKTVLASSSQNATTVSIYAGTLQYSADAQLSNSTQGIVLNGSFGSGAALVANVAGGNITTARTIALGVQGGNYIDVIGGNTLTLSNVISGTQSAIASNIVTFGGASAVDVTNNAATSGIIALTAANTYSGGTTFAGGTVNLGVAEVAGGNGPLGIGGTLTFTGGTMQHSASNQFDYSSRFSPIANQQFRIDTNGQNVTYASTLAGASSALTKSGAGTLTLSGANTYTGATTIQAGTLSVARAQSLGQGNTVNLGVASTSPGTLLYTGGIGTLDKNVNAVGNGNNTIENNGGGTLTLSGTLAKNGTTLVLRNTNANSQIIVSNAITGANPNSDLIVSGGTTTLNAANTYVGPTSVIDAGTLVLGINNAIPSNSAVTLGNAGTAGTLNMGSSTNAIGSLSFGAGGGTLALAANQTGTAQLAASGTVVLGSNSLNLTGMATSAGLYKLVSGSSLSGTFGTVTGLNSNYVLRYGTVTANQLDAQRKATIGAITATPAAAAIITGGSTAFGVTVSNTAPTDSSNLAFSAVSGSNTTGSITGPVSVAPGATSGSTSGLSFNGTTVGAGQSGNFTVNDTGSTNSGQAGSVSVDVYGHASGSVASNTLALGNVRVGYASPVTSSSVSATNASGYRVNLTGSTAAIGNISLNTLTSTAAGGSNNITATLATGQAVGAISENFTYTFADSSALSGASSNVGTVSLTVTGGVYNVASSAASQTVTLSTRPGVGVSTNLSVTNTGAATAPYQENLGSTGFTGTTSGYTSSGSITGLAGGASGSGTLSVGVLGSTVMTSGGYTGATTTLGLQTQEVNSSGLGDAAITSQTVGINVNVYDFAGAVFSQTGGDGSFSGSGLSYNLDFGTGLELSTNYSATINLANGLFSLYKDSLAGAYGTVGGAFSETATNFSSLTSGGSGTFTINFFTGTVGSFTDNLTFDGTSLNTPLGNSSLSQITIALSGAAIPEPNVAALIGGFGVLALLRRRRNA